VSTPPRGFGLCRLDSLSGFDTILIGLNRSAVCVFRLVCDEFDFRLTHDEMGRVSGTYGTHIPSLLEMIGRVTHGVVHGFLRGSVNVAQIAMALST
jgi:hypothetical protein